MTDGVLTERERDESVCITEREMTECYYREESECITERER